ncbi:NADH-quinone oxidoreductase subunit J [Tessaracoccus flavus]|jgi:NADH-quinone oxidoreductase subunit J|uniref:NADH-quinone oxidoreductase subunit J n=1 Tax=Tessaracoccus flavus TaxID=1610493 RepID=A0A1Q2CCT4_9ACTN|nr:NADH-quinone oxidoreductase subunit J [Tessaracoccus flavus]AQP43855.1 NADH:ubiquinone oxidoreductase subunit J [Tessaracoccus flavus]SDY26341.1 NADH dehydrogenase subunit J [Tessaracoccus flavus]
MMPLVPLVTAGEVAFWVCAPIAVLCALGFLLSRKPVHSAIFMAGVMISLAVLYAAQDAPFLFVIQIVVYTGAILMLFLFVVMLIGVDSTDSVVETIRGHRVTSALVAVGVGVLLVLAVGQNAVYGEPAGLAAANAEYGGNIQSIAALLFSKYVFLFEATAALMITAAVGAMLLAHGERLKRKRNQIETLTDRVRAYAETGEHPGPLPNSGVFARHNAISTPALLPDGSVAEKSISKTLAMRGVIVDVNELRAPTNAAYAVVEKRTSEIEGDDE